MWSAKGFKYRFILWALVMLCVLLFFARSLFSSISFDTNILQLLPSASHNQVAQDAGQLFSSRLERRVIFLVGSKTKERSVQAANVFFNVIHHQTIFKRVNYLENTNQQVAWGRFYFPYRLSLFSPSQQTLLQTHQSEKIVQSALFSLYSPTGLVNSTLLATDPYFTFLNFMTTLPKPANNISLFHQRLMVHFKNKWYVMITGTLHKNSFSMATQNKITNLITLAQKNMPQVDPQATVLKTGYLFFAKAGADMAQHDISTIGIGSIIGIILLMLITFRSLSPIIFTLLSALLGFITAFVFTSWWFGKLYLFTLIFGASLIGICVDYAFFYYAEQLLGGKNWNPKDALRNIFRAISFGLINLLLAYFVILLTPAPVLKQLAVFAIVGLFVSYATVVCAFPYFLKAKQKVFYSPILKMTNMYLSLWNKITPKILVILYSVFFVTCAIGLTQLRANDDVHQLESMPANLLHQDKTIQNAIGSKLGTTFYVVTGNTADKTLTHVDELTTQLNKIFHNNQQLYLSLNAFVPSLENQRLNFQMNKKILLGKKLLVYLEKIGVNQQKAAGIQKKLLAIPFKPLTIHAWLKSNVSQSLRFLWLGKLDHQYASIVLLAQNLSKHKLQEIVAHHSSVTYVNNAQNVSQVFKWYRQKIFLLLCAIYGVLLLLFLWRYKLKKGFIYFLPSLGAGLMSLAVMGLCNIPLTLFSVLALVLVLGISMDYVLFFVETKTTYESTTLAVTLSAITTLLSFGLLSLSHTPVVHFFGVTLLVGIFTAFILAPSVLIMREKK